MTRRKESNNDNITNLIGKIPDNSKQKSWQTNDQITGIIEQWQKMKESNKEKIKEWQHSDEKVKILTCQYNIIRKTR